MDSLNFGNKLSGFLKKYKYVALVLAIGIFLMALPQEKEDIISNPEIPETELTVSDSLEEILAQIDGVGKVRVMLTESRGREVLYQTDSDSQTSENNNSLQVDTVIISDNDRKEAGLIRQEIPPSYLGAIVVCQGAEQASIRLAIIQSVSNVTGISTDRITVLKMK